MTPVERHDLAYADYFPARKRLRARLSGPLLDARAAGRINIQEIPR